MLGASYIRSRLLRLSRLAYNSRRYASSARRARLTYSIFRDRDSLDILARSLLRMKKFRKAASAYRKANLRGLSLLDHNINHFKSEIGAGNLVISYGVFSELRGPEKDQALEMLVKSLKKYNDTEKIELIQQMNEISNLPERIANLLPWTPQKIDFIDDEEKYSDLKSGSLNNDMYVREINRIKSSGSFQILNHLSDAIRSPIKLLKLPFTLPKLTLSLILQRTGRLNEYTGESHIVSSPGVRRKCIVMFPTNGVGFGHFTRLLAISRDLIKKHPEYEVVFFTTMPTLHIPTEEGIICYHLPGRYRYENMDASTWNTLCEELLSTIFALHRPKAFVFDGAYPYRGMLNSVKSQAGMLKIWLKRGTVKKNSKATPAGSIKHFDAIIKPGDSIKEEPTEEAKFNIPIYTTNPILLEGKQSENVNDEIRKRLGIPTESILCYVQLGAGRINDINDELKMTLEALSKHKSVYTVVGESMIGERLDLSGIFDDERIRILRDYPNSRYFGSFDFAIIAGGYNSYHEIVNFQVPAICYPNLKTGRDDQLTRANVARKKGAMVVLEKRNSDNISIAIERMLDRSVRQKMKNRLGKLITNNGSQQASEWLINQISE